MTCPADESQPGLFAPTAPPSWTVDIGTRHTEMIEKAIKAARNQGLIEDIDEGLISIARANARALDVAESMGKKSCYAIANISGPYREVLAALRLTPADRNVKSNDDLADALQAFAAATVRDTAS